MSGLSAFSAMLSRNRNFAFILATVLIDMLAWGIAIPVMPALVKQLLNGDVSAGARYLGWLIAAFSIMQFVAAPLLGALSDRFGRRPVLLGSMFGMAVDCSIMALAPNIAWLFVGRAFGGLTSSGWATASAYVADITPPEQRTERFGGLNAAFGAGLVLGPVIGGLIGQIDPRWPFWTGAALCVVNGMYGLFVLPESRPPKAGARMDFRKLNPIQPFSLYLTRPGLLSLGASVLLFVLGQQVFYSAMLPYLDARYHFSPGMIGATIMAGGVAVIFSQLFVVRFAKRYLGEPRALLVSLACAALAMLLFGLAPTGVLFLCVIPLRLLSSVQEPVSQAMMSRLVDETQQGQLQGTSASLQAIASIVGLLLFSEALAHALGPWSHWAPIGLPFMISAGLMVIALVVAIVFLASRRAAANQIAAQAGSAD